MPRRCRRRWRTTQRSRRPRRWSCSSERWAPCSAVARCGPMCWPRRAKRWDSMAKRRWRCFSTTPLGPRPCSRRSSRSGRFSSRRLASSPSFRGRSTRSGRFRRRPARSQWRHVVVGALVTALFSVGKLLIGLYFARTAFASSFGAAGSFAVYLAWVYYTAQIFFFGAEITRAHAELARADKTRLRHLGWLRLGSARASRRGRCVPPRCGDVVDERRGDEGGTVRPR